jgi:formyl-CoA transferase
VIKVENPAGGDETRSWPPSLGDVGGYFATVNRSKRDIAIDLKRPEGIEIVHRLFGRADVIMESFTPGVADRLGIGYERARAIKESVVYYSLSGFGQDGPWRERRGYDPILQAVSGHMSVMGEKDRGPVKSMVPIADLSSASHGLAAILGALLFRERTGRGQRIDMSMFDVMVSMLSVVGMRYLVTGDVPTRHGTENPQRVPSAAFECRDGHYLQVVPNQRQWPAFCRLVDEPSWVTDPRFATPIARVEHQEVIYPRLREKFLTKTAAEWEKSFREGTIACSRINSIDEVFELDQVRHRRLVVEYDIDGIGVVRGLRPPFNLSDGNADVHRPPARLGEHTSEILDSIGYDAARIAHLIRDRVVHQHQTDEPT